MKKWPIPTRHLTSDVFLFLSWLFTLNEGKQAHNAQMKGEGEGLNM